MNEDFIISVSKKYELSPAEDPMDFIALQKKMRAVIAHLLDTNPEKLIHMLYLLDIDEQKVDETLHSSDLTDIPKHLTEMILVREFQKYKTQKQ